MACRRVSEDTGPARLGLTFLAPQGPATPSEPQRGRCMPHCTTNWAGPCPEQTHSSCSTPFEFEPSTWNGSGSWVDAYAVFTLRHIPVSHLLTAYATASDTPPPMSVVAAGAVAAAHAAAPELTAATAIASALLSSSSNAAAAASSPAGPSLLLCGNSSAASFIKKQHEADCGPAPITTTLAAQMRLQQVEPPLFAQQEPSCASRPASVSAAQAPLLLEPSTPPPVAAAAAAEGRWNSYYCMGSSPSNGAASGMASGVGWGEAVYGTHEAFATATSSGGLAAGTMAVFAATEVGGGGSGAGGAAGGGDNDICIYALSCGWCSCEEEDGNGSSDRAFGPLLVIPVPEASPAASAPAHRPPTPPLACAAQAAWAWAAGRSTSDRCKSLDSLCAAAHESPPALAALAVQPRTASFPPIALLSTDGGEDGSAPYAVPGVRSYSSRSCAAETRTGPLPAILMLTTEEVGSGGGDGDESADCIGHLTATRGSKQRSRNAKSVAVAAAAATACTAAAPGAGPMESSNALSSSGSNGLMSGPAVGCGRGGGVGSLWTSVRGLRSALSACFRVHSGRGMS